MYTWWESWNCLDGKWNQVSSYLVAQVDLSICTLHFITTRVMLNLPAFEMWTFTLVASNNIWIESLVAFLLLGKLGCAFATKDLKSLWSPFWFKPVETNCCCGRNYTALAEASFFPLGGSAFVLGIWDISYSMMACICTYNKTIGNHSYHSIYRCFVNSPCPSAMLHRGKGRLRGDETFTCVVGGNHHLVMMMEKVTCEVALNLHLRGEGNHHRVMMMEKVTCEVA